MKKIDQDTLPIRNPKYKDLILKAIRTHQLVVITGSTGCGKSTQVPQFIIDEIKTSRKVTVTTPTRISAISLAEFVARCRGSIVGEEVGYSIGGDKMQNSYQTRIEYQTVGVLKEKLISRSPIKTSHIIIDEVHERSLDIDTTLFLLKRYLKRAKNVHVVLMSATIESKTFQKYFANDYHHNIPYIHVPSRLFEVNLRFMKGVFKYLGYDGEKDIKDIHDVYDLNFAKVYKDVESVAVELVYNLHKDHRLRGYESFLIFLPGLAEINQFQRELYDKSRLSFDEVQIHILHSTIPMSEQKTIFEDSEKRKIILATNIAESSITIPDVRVVIDFCLFKEMNLNFHNGAEELKLKWASRESLEQRKGRAGRVQDGFCFELIPKAFVTKELIPKSITPEMRRISLSHLILKLLRSFRNPENLLRKFITPPDMRNIQKAYADLEEIGAVTPRNHRITNFGSFMVEFPLNLNNCFFVYLGLIFGYLREAIVLASLIDAGGIIFQKSNLPNSYLRELYRYDKYHRSDAIANYIAYTTYLEHNISETRKKWSRGKYCFKNGINSKRLSEVENKIEMVRQKFELRYRKTLKDHETIRNDEDTLMFLKHLICVSYMKNIMKLDSSSVIDFPEGFDPSRSVQLEMLEKVGNERNTIDRIKNFVSRGSGYDGGFGVISKSVLVPRRSKKGKRRLEGDEDEKEYEKVPGIFCEVGKRKVYVQFEPEELDNLKDSNDEYHQIRNTNRNFDFKEDDDFYNEETIDGYLNWRDEFRPVQLITRLTYNQFKKFGVSTKGDGRRKRTPTMTYREAKGEIHLKFKALFYSDYPMISRFSLVDNFITRGRLKERKGSYNLVFSSSTPSSVLYADMCTVLPPFESYPEILFLLFANKLKKSDIGMGYMEVVLNETIYYFKPALNSKIVDYINNIRRYVKKACMGRYTKKFQHWQKNDKFEYKQNQAKNTMIELFKLYEKSYKRYWRKIEKKRKRVEGKNYQTYGELINSDGFFRHLKVNPDQIVLQRELDFVKDFSKKNDILVKYICCKIFSFCYFETEEKISILLIIIEMGKRNISEFYSLLRTVERGKKMTFHVSDRFEIGIEMVEVGGKVSKVGGSGRKMKELERIFRRQFSRIEREYESIETVRDKRRKRVFELKRTLFIIPYDIVERKGSRRSSDVEFETYVIFRNNQKNILSENRDPSISIFNQCLFLLSKLVYDKLSDDKKGTRILKKHFKKVRKKKKMFVLPMKNYDVVFFPVPYYTNEKLISRKVQAVKFFRANQIPLDKDISLRHLFYFPLSKFVKEILRERSDMRVGSITSSRGRNLEMFFLQFLPSPLCIYGDKTVDMNYRDDRNSKNLLSYYGVRILESNGNEERKNENESFFDVEYLASKTISDKVMMKRKVYDLVNFRNVIIRNVNRIQSNLNYLYRLRNSKLCQRKLQMNWDIIDSPYLLQFDLIEIEKNRYFFENYFQDTFHACSSYKENLENDIEVLQIEGAHLSRVLYKILPRSFSLYPLNLICQFYGVNEIFRNRERQRLNFLSTLFAYWIFELKIRKRIYYSEIEYKNYMRMKKREKKNKNKKKRKDYLLFKIHEIRTDQEYEIKCNGISHVVNKRDLVEVYIRKIMNKVLWEINNQENLTGKRRLEEFEFRIMIYPLIQRERHEEICLFYDENKENYLSRYYKKEYLDFEFEVDNKRTEWTIKFIVKKHPEVQFLVEDVVAKRKEKNREMYEKGEEEKKMEKDNYQKYEKYRKKFREFVKAYEHNRSLKSKRRGGRSRKRFRKIRIRKRKEKKGEEEEESGEEERDKFYYYGLSSYSSSSESSDEETKKERSQKEKGREEKLKIEQERRNKSEMKYDQEREKYKKVKKIKPKRYRETTYYSKELRKIKEDVGKENSVDRDYEMEFFYYEPRNEKSNEVDMKNNRIDENRNEISVENKNFGKERESSGRISASKSSVKERRFIENEVKTNNDKFYSPKIKMIEKKVKKSDEEVNVESRSKKEVLMKEYEICYRKVDVSRIRRVKIFFYSLMFSKVHWILEGGNGENNSERDFFFQFDFQQPKDLKRSFDGYLFKQIEKRTKIKNLLFRKDRREDFKSVFRSLLKIREKERGVLVNVCKKKRELILCMPLPLFCFYEHNEYHGGDVELQSLEYSSWQDSDHYNVVKYLEFVEDNGRDYSRKINESMYVNYQ